MVSLMHRCAEIFKVVVQISSRLRSGTFAISGESAQMSESRDDAELIYGLCIARSVIFDIILYVDVDVTVDS